MAKETKFFLQLKKSCLRQVANRFEFDSFLMEDDDDDGDDNNNDGNDQELFYCLLSTRLKKSR